VADAQRAEAMPPDPPRGRRGMGRGLAAILPETEEQAPELRRVAVDLIRPNPDQPRTRFDPETISELAHSIETAGVVQPLIVRPLSSGQYELVAGERRWRAAQEAGLTEVPVVVRDEGENERLQTALIENMAREDLNPVDEARACATLVDDLGLTKEELARRVGRSRVAVSNLIRLLDLPDPALELLRSKQLSEGHGRAILQARGTDARRRLARQAASEGWSVRETERRAKLASKASGSRPGRGRRSADEAEAITQAEDALEEAIGRDVRVRATKDGLKAELVFDDLDEVRELARRLGARR
jgi:ParB family transcriptional regulator, chromosome partitioning protein